MKKLTRIKRISWCAMGFFFVALFLAALLLEYDDGWATKRWVLPLFGTASSFFLGTGFFANDETIEKLPFPFF